MSLKRIELVFSAGIVLLMLWVVWEARTWPFRTKLFPEMIGYPVLAIALLQLAQAAWKEFRPEPGARPSRSAEAPADHSVPVALDGTEAGQYAAAYATAAEEDTTAAPQDPAVVRWRTLEVLGWFAGFALCIWLLGFKVGSPLMSLAFMRFQAHESWKASIIAGVTTYVFFIVVFDMVASLPFSPGLIAESLGMQSFDWYLTNPIVQALQGQW